MTQYYALDKYFLSKAADEVNELSLTFSEIAAINDHPLPQSAWSHGAWWGNHAPNPQASWARAGYKASVNRTTEIAHFRYGEMPSTPSSGTKFSISTERTNLTLDGLQVLDKLDIDWIRAVIECSCWVTSEIFHHVGKNNGTDALGVFYPFTVRKQQTKKVGWEVFRNERRFVDLNHRPQAAISYALTGRGFHSGTSNYTCCHIYGGDYVRDWKSFTNLANLVLVPRPLQALTDHHHGVIKELQAISFHLFGWKPPDAPTPRAPVAELLPLVKQVGAPQKTFNALFQREIQKHRATYREAFGENPAF